MPARSLVLWLLAYAAVMAAVVVALVAARRRVLATLDTPQARREWRQWKQKAGEQPEQASPVRRRPVASDEPPALILMRDRFTVIVATSVVIGSFLFAFLAFVARGAFRRGGPAA